MQMTNTTTIADENLSIVTRAPIVMDDIKLRHICRIRDRRPNEMCRYRETNQRTKGLVILDI